VGGRRAFRSPLRLRSPPRPNAGACTGTVLIADDQALVRYGLRLIVDAQPDLTVVGEASRGKLLAGWRCRRAKPTHHVCDHGQSGGGNGGELSRDERIRSVFCGGEAPGLADVFGVGHDDLDPFLP